jgi:beta-carotene 15,15'-dioxygenase
VAVANAASTSVELGQEEDARRSVIGCGACFLLASAFVIDRGGGGLDLLEWAGPSACLLLAAGMPHGALDIELLRGNRRVLGGLALVRCIVGYVGLTLVTLGLWWLFPKLALIIFLVLSAYHFGGDWTGLRRATERTLVGTALIAAPAALHTDSVAFIFSWLVAPTDAVATATALQWISAPLAVGVGALVALKARRHRAQCEEICVLILSALALPPLTFLVIYFCALHSMRHLVDVRRDLRIQTIASLIVGGSPYGLAAIGCCVAGAVLFPRVIFAEALLSATFIGLAALTVPHMLLNELLLRGIADPSGGLRRPLGRRLFQGPFAK